MALKLSKAFGDENSSPKNNYSAGNGFEATQNSICSPKRFAEVSLDSFLRFAGFAKTENQENNNDKNIQMGLANISHAHIGKDIRESGYYMSGSVMMRFKKPWPLQKVEERWMILQLRISNTDEGINKHDNMTYLSQTARARLRYKPLMNNGKKKVKWKAIYVHDIRGITPMKRKPKETNKWPYGVCITYKISARKDRTLEFMCDSQQDMSNWITALSMAREMCNSSADPADASAKRPNHGNPSKNDTIVNNSLQLPPEALFQEAVYQQTLDSIWDPSSRTTPDSSLTAHHHRLLSDSLRMLSTAPLALPYLTLKTRVMGGDDMADTVLLCRVSRDAEVVWGEGTGSHLTCRVCVWQDDLVNSQRQWKAEGNALRARAAVMQAIAKRSGAASRLCTLPVCQIDVGCVRLQIEATAQRPTSRTSRLSWSPIRPKARSRKSMSPAAQHSSNKSVHAISPAPTPAPTDRMLVPDPNSPEDNSEDEHANNLSDSPCTPSHEDDLTPSPKACEGDPSTPVASPPSPVPSPRHGSTRSASTPTHEDEPTPSPKARDSDPSSPVASTPSPVPSPRHASIRSASPERTTKLSQTESSDGMTTPPRTRTRPRPRGVPPSPPALSPEPIASPPQMPRSFAYIERRERLLTAELFVPGKRVAGDASGPHYICAPPGKDAGAPEPVGVFATPNRVRSLGFMDTAEKLFATVRHCPVPSTPSQQPNDDSRHVQTALFTPSPNTTPFSLNSAGSATSHISVANSIDSHSQNEDMATQQVTKKTQRSVKKRRNLAESFDRVELKTTTDNTAVAGEEHENDPEMEETNNHSLTFESPLSVKSAKSVKSDISETQWAVTPTSVNGKDEGTKQSSLSPEQLMRSSEKSLGITTWSDSTRSSQIRGDSLVLSRTIKSVESVGENEVTRTKYSSPSTSAIATPSRTPLRSPPSARRSTGGGHKRSLNASARGLLQHVLDALPLATDTDLQLRRMRTGRVYVSQLDTLLPLEEQPTVARPKNTPTQRLRSEFLQRWCGDTDPMLDVTLMNNFIRKQRDSAIMALVRHVHAKVMQSLWLLDSNQMVAAMHSFGVSMRWLGDVAKHCLGRTLGSRCTGKKGEAPTGPFSRAVESEKPVGTGRRRRRSSIYLEGNAKRLSMQSFQNASPYAYLARFCEVQMVSRVCKCWLRGQIEKTWRVAGAESLQTIRAITLPLVVQMLKALFGEQSQAFWNEEIKPMVKNKFGGYTIANRLEDRAASLWSEVLRQCGVRYQPSQAKGKSPLPPTNYVWNSGLWVDTLHASDFQVYCKVKTSDTAMFAEWSRSSFSPPALDLGLCTIKEALAPSEKSREGLAELLAQYSVPLAMLSRGHSIGSVMGYRIFELFTPGVVTALTPAPEAGFASSALCGLAETLWDAAVGLYGKTGDCMFLLTPRSELVSDALRCAQACKKVLGKAGGLVRARLESVLFCCLLTEGVVKDSDAAVTSKAHLTQALNGVALYGHTKQPLHCKIEASAALAIFFSIKHLPAKQLFPEADGDATGLVVRLTLMLARVYVALNRQRPACNELDDALLLCNEVHDTAVAAAEECSLVVSTAAAAHYNRGLLGLQHHDIVKGEMTIQELEAALTHAAKAYKFCSKALLMKGDDAPTEQTQLELQVFQGQISLLRGRLHRAIASRAGMDADKLPGMALHYDAAIMCFAHTDEQELFSTSVLELCQLAMSVHMLPFFPMHSELSMSQLMNGLMDDVRSTTQPFSSKLTAVETPNLARTAAVADPEDSQWVDLDDEVDRRDMQEHQTDTQKKMLVLFSLVAHTC